MWCEVRYIGAEFVAVTLASPITAPVLSVTVPVIVPSPAVCAAQALDAHLREAQASQNEESHMGGARKKGSAAAWCCLQEQSCG